MEITVSGFEGGIRIEARYYGRVAGDTIDETLDKAIREETGRQLLANADFKEQIARLACQQILEIIKKK